MKRNPDVLVDVYGLFSGSLMAFEDNFGGLSGLTDEEVIQYIKEEWAPKNGSDIVIVMYKFEPTYWSKILPAFDMKILTHMRDYYSTDQGFAHPSYKDQIIQAINEEIRTRGH